MRCGACRRKLPLYERGELTSTAREALQRHLAACGPCRAHAEQWRRLESLLGPAPAVPPRRDLWPVLTARLRAEPAARRAPRRRTRWEPAAGLAGALALAAVAGVLLVGHARQTAPANDPQIEAWLANTEAVADPWAGEVAENLDWVLDEGV